MGMSFALFFAGHAVTDKQNVMKDFYFSVSN
jgi:hypothetical protein